VSAAHSNSAVTDHHVNPRLAKEQRDDLKALVRFAPK
jgi:hypothetical protein